MERTLIGTIERNYWVYQISPTKFEVCCKVGDFEISIENFKFYDEMSEETLCFSGEIAINGDKVGTCSNRGVGGCADYHAHNSYDLLNKVDSLLRETENYCFPKMKLSLPDALDNLANILVMFKDNKVKSYKRAFDVIVYLQNQAIKYRKQYGGVFDI
jgi:hypothetical protein